MHFVTLGYVAKLVTYYSITIRVMLIIIIIIITFTGIYIHLTSLIERHKTCNKRMDQKQK